MMRFSISVLDLEHLTGASGISSKSGGDLDARLREIFYFLPPDTDYSLDDSGVLHVEVPEPEHDKKKSAERHAEKAARAARNGDYSKARKLFTKAVDLDPTLTTARRDLAMLCSEIGDHEAAKDNLIDVLRVTPEDAWSYVILANHYSKAENNPKMAVTLLKRAIEIAPDDPYAHNSLAAAHLEEGREEEAIQHFDLALNANPHFANAHYGKAMVYVRRQDFPRAEAAFEALFHQSDHEDARAGAMLQEARSTFIKVENIIANNRQEESLCAVRDLRRDTEELSRYPVKEPPANFPSTSARKSAWPGNTGSTITNSF